MAACFCVLYVSTDLVGGLCGAGESRRGLRGGGHWRGWAWPLGGVEAEVKKIPPRVLAHVSNDVSLCARLLHISRRVCTWPKEWAKDKSKSSFL